MFAFVKLKSYLLQHDNETVHLAADLCSKTHDPSLNAY